jgi:putative phosphoesterase
MRLGVISDTHGLLRPEAEAALAGVDHILHAGDIGDPEIVARLDRIAPVTAIRGNVDRGDWAARFPETAEPVFGGRPLLMLHDVKALGTAWRGRNVAAVISGHSHKPGVTWHDGVLFLNPGAAGPQRFRLPVTLALLDIGDPLQAEIIDLAA